MWSSSTTRRREAALVFIPTNNKNSRFVSLTEEEEGAGWDLDGEVSASAAAAGSKRMSAVLGIHKDAENDIFMPNAGGIARRGGATAAEQGGSNLIILSLRLVKMNSGPSSRLDIGRAVVSIYAWQGDNLFETDQRCG
jgi:hypothetical protein